MSSTNKAGLVLSDASGDRHYAVVLDRNAGKLALHKITSGSWGGALGNRCGPGASLPGRTLGP